MAIPLASGAGVATCDYSLLTPSEAANVHELEIDRNRLSCLSGQEPCDKASLTVAEAKEVDSIERNKNFLACKTGLGYCDNSLLTLSEAKQLAQDSSPRNMSRNDSE